MSKPQKPKRRKRSDGPPVEGYRVRLDRSVDKYADTGWGYTFDRWQEEQERDRYERWRGNMEGE